MSGNDLAWVALAFNCIGMGSLFLLVGIIKVLLWWRWDRRKAWQWELYQAEMDASLGEFQVRGGG